MDAALTGREVVMSVEHVTIRYADTPVVSDVSLTLRHAEILALLGTNGSGKSSLLRAMSGLLRPVSGLVSVGGRPVTAVRRRDLARQVAHLPQQPESPGELAVAQLVWHGRHPHRRRFGGRSREDEEAVAEALDFTDTRRLADRPVGSLSGGERQRVWMAVVVAQRAPILLLDEPTTFLDIAHQLELLDLIRRLRAERGTTTVVVLHDINLAARFATRLVVLARQRVVLDGPPDDVLRSGEFADAFGVDLGIVAEPRGARPLCVPYLRSRPDRLVANSTDAP